MPSRLRSPEAIAPHGCCLERPMLSRAWPAETQPWASLSLSFLVFTVGTTMPVSQILFEDEGLKVPGELESGDDCQRLSSRQ